MMLETRDATVVLLHALLTAAICSWALESPFYELTRLSSPLFDQYRTLFKQQFKQQGGKDCMPDLDLIAHRALVKSQEWAERVVYGKASALTKTFLEALKPLFVSHVQGQRPRPGMLSDPCLGGAFVE